MKNQKRGKNVAIIGAILQTVVTIVMFIIWRMTGSNAVLSGLWLILGGVPLWLITAVLFYTRQLAQQESMELQELQARGGEGDNIFDESTQLAIKPAAARVVFMERWIVPAFTLLFSAYNAVIAILILRFLFAADPPILTKTSEGAVFLLLVAFGLFLFSRYCTGMGSQSQWQLLRATGSYLLMCTLFVTAIFISLLLASQDSIKPEIVVAFILPIIEVIYAVELLLNFILDIYRPRVPGDEYTPSYDSRLFNLLAEPGRVGHSIADTINYQFGFEVSKTWFYQLISRACLPLLIFAVVVMFAMSSVVLVQPGEQYVVKHWGKISPSRSTLSPGIHLKWPWPIDTAQRFETGVIHQIFLGMTDEETNDEDEDETEADDGHGHGSKKQGNKHDMTRDGEPLIVWTKEHGHGSQKERDFLIGVPRRQHQNSPGETDSSKAPAVSIIKLAAVVQYRVTAPYKYGYKFTNAKKILQCLAEEEMVEYCASATLDQAIEGVTDRPQAIMTFGREAAAKAMKKRIQGKLDNIDLGVEIVYVGIISAHPPAAAVPQYEKVLETERLQDQQRYKAQAEANRILSQVAGDPGNALELFLALRKSEVFEELGKMSKKVKAKAKDDVLSKAVNEFIRRTRGQISALDLEIYREELLGKSKGDMPIHIKLRNGYQQFLSQLQGVKKQRKSFRYDKAKLEASQRVDALFAKLSGEPARLIADAQAYRWQRHLGEQIRLETYQRMLLPYREAPRAYMFDRYMDVLDETLPGMKKYIIGVDRKKLDLRMNLEQQRSVLGESLDASKN